MNKVDKDQLVALLQTHVNDINGLIYKNYGAAESLYQRTKMFATKYFPTRTYGIDLITIKFRVTSAFFEIEANVWNNGIEKLSSIAQAMLDDAKLTPIQMPIQVPAQTPLIKVIEDTSKIDKLTFELNKSKKDLLILENRFKVFRKYTLCITSFILISIILWSFNDFVTWHWLSIHPKRVAIYLAFQLLILLIHLRFITERKAFKTAEIVAIIVAVIIGILTLI
jgi:hypothetical protein